MPPLLPASLPILCRIVVIECRTSCVRPPVQPCGKRGQTEPLAQGGSAVLVLVIRSVRKEIRKTGRSNSTPVGLERCADYRSAQTQVKTKRPRQKGEQRGGPARPGGRLRRRALTVTRPRGYNGRLRSVAQPGSASDLGSEGRRFESYRSDQKYPNNGLDRKIQAVFLWVLRVFRRVCTRQPCRAACGACNTLSPREQVRPDHRASKKHQYHRRHHQPPSGAMLAGFDLRQP